MDFLTINDIKQAKERINKYVTNTPILSSSLLNKWLGHKIFFKAECMQKTGAFKVRGACNTITWLMENNLKPQHIVANSSGNHAQAIAWASCLFGIPSAIYMPAYSSKVKIQATKAYGAEVVLCDSRITTDEKVRQASEEPGTYWIPPFNHEQVISGQGTAAYDALTELGQIDAVFTPCGGGGLLSGTLISTRALAPKAQVIGAEPLNANDAALSLRANTIHKLTSTPDTIADGVMTLSVGNITFEYLKMIDDMYEMEESDIIYWTQWLTHLLKLRIEPTSALAMAAAFRWLSKQTSPKEVLILLSGGNIDQETSLKIWEHNYLEEVPGL